MSNTRAYTVPDYYESFSCKGPDCRSTCCRGWGISVSLKEYYRLTGMPCSKKLRQKLDRAFHLAEHPTNERYALINPTYDGDCPLHRSDGYCAVQKECGESVLASVCRYYPRSVRSGFFQECACSNSCEAVLELLQMHKAPLTFHQTSLTLDFIDPANQHCALPESRRSIRRLCIALLQDRQYPLPVRLARIGYALRALSGIKDEARIQDYLADCAQSAPTAILTATDLPFALVVQRTLVGNFDALSHNFQRYGETALSYFSDDEPLRYAQASAHFDEVMPDWPRFFEQILVNHIFFTAFPFSDLTETPVDAFASLCAVYAVLRFLVLADTAQRADSGHVVDVLAAAFRLIDHTDFDKNAVLLLREAHCKDETDLQKLLQA